MFQYDKKEDDLSRCSNESEEDDEGETPVEELFKKPKKGKKGQRTENLVNDLVDTILNNANNLDKCKEKLLLTNVKNIKNSQYYNKVTEELKARCSERGEKSPLIVEQTRQKFKRCIIICRDAVMKVKRSFGIKHFQQMRR